MTLEEFLSAWHDGQPTVVVHTSGSTGAPRPMLAEKERMRASARITCDFLGLREGDTVLLCLPLDYIAGKMMVVRSLERGLRLTAVEPGGHPLSAVSGPFDLVAMVPLQVWNTLQVARERERLCRVRHLIIGGGAVSDELLAQLKNLPNSVWSTYGMTETLSHIALRRLNGPEASEWYTPFEGVRLSLSADNCLVIDAPAVCAEPLTTRDIAELSADGRFRILGRLDNTICSGGLKIQAEQLEHRLAPFLATPFLVSKRPDEKFGEVVVLLTEGTVDEARAVCERELPRHHRPRVYVHVDRIPLTETGKPARGEAARLAAAVPEK
ncbi:MAG: AMP-binding protein [Prevotella sp.]|nr:AMP-binding protein [Prevotella sp.]